MKKIFFVAALLGFINGAYAQNTFPTDPGTNVGIGTTSPATALHVKATSNTAGFSTLTIENSGATGNEAGIAFKGGYTTTSLNSGRIYSLFDGGTSYSSARTTIQSMLSGGVYDNTFTVRNAKVGVGTVNPVALLHVNDINTATSTRGNVFIGTTDAATIDAGGQLGFGGSYTGTTQTSWAGIAGRKENATDGDYSGYLQFITRKNGSSTVERARLTSEGNLGVGTTTPGLKTHINGISGFPATTGTAQTGVLRLQGLSTNAVLDFGVNGVSGAYLQATNQTALNTNYPLLLNPNGGNVAIGTVTPATTSLLQVQKNVDGSNLSTFVNNDPGVNARTGVIVGSTPGTGGTFGSLEYWGAGRTVTGLLAADRTMVRGNGAGGMMLTAENAGGVIGFATGGISGANERMRITSTGNVGIGVTNPTDKLAVNGTIHTKEVRVDLTGWPDYVFKKDYKLLTLTVVKKYIDQNHHLPDMPSEKEIIAKGLNLGEMNKLLTKKVEELTLYLIAKDEELKKQQQEISSQKSDMDLLKQQMKELQTLVKK